MTPSIPNPRTEERLLSESKANHTPMIATHFHNYQNVSQQTTSEMMVIPPKENTIFPMNPFLEFESTYFGVSNANSQVQPRDDRNAVSTNYTYSSRRGVDSERQMDTPEDQNIFFNAKKHEPYQIDTVSTPVKAMNPFADFDSSDKKEDGTLPDSQIRDDQNILPHHDPLSMTQRGSDSERQTSISDFQDISFDVKKSNNIFRKSFKKKSTPTATAGLPLASPGKKTPKKSFLTPIKSARKRLSRTSTNGKTGKDEEEVDKNIGLRLALPDKLDIMCGREAPGTSQKKEADEVDSIVSSGSFQHMSSDSKKIIILPEEGRRNSVSLNSVRKSARKSMSSKLNKKKPEMSLKQSTSMPSASTPNDNDVSTSVENVEYTIQAKKLVLRSSEMDPSVHQITIPHATDILIHARVCALMESYDRLLESRAKAKKRWFSFEQLVGRSRTELETMYLEGIGKKPSVPIYIGKDPLPGPPPLPQGGNPFASIVPSSRNPFEPNETHKTDDKSASITSYNSGSLDIPDKTKVQNRKDTSQIKSVRPHPSIIKSLLECYDDILVEGYFCETVTTNSSVMSEEEDSNIVQATIFSSQRQRQFIVCYRGSMGQHTKPVKNVKKHKKDDCQQCVLDCDNPIPINPNFGDAYFESKLEEKVFNLIEKLSSDNPFCDVVFTGHSFGAALSLIGSVRYADLYPMRTVSCITFGVPKIGGLAFRHFGNSLSNLKIMRVEYGSDYFVKMPDDAKWEHVGHAIVISTPSNVVPSSTKTGSTRNLLSQRKSNSNSSTLDVKQTQAADAHVKALKFGDGKKISTRANSNTSSQNSQGLSNVVIDTSILKPKKNKFQGKIDHQMRSYLHGIELFTHLGLPWVSNFVGEEGGGIVSEVDNELRHVV